MPRRALLAVFLLLLLEEASSSRGRRQHTALNSQRSSSSARLSRSSKSEHLLHSEERLSHSNRRHSHAALAARDASSSGTVSGARARAAALYLGESNCLSIGAKLCACKPPDSCGASLAQQCANDFCHACRRLAWTCDISIAKDAAAFGAMIGTAERRALCRQVVGNACGALFKCCKVDAAYLAEETDASFDGDGFGSVTAEDGVPWRPQLPIGACAHNESDADESKAKCSTCKSAISLNLTATPERCSIGSPLLENAAATVPAGVADPGAAGYASLEERVSRATEGGRAGGRTASPLSARNQLER